MNINISGLPPNTMHGFHIHEFGDINTKGELTLLKPSATERTNTDILLTILIYYKQNRIMTFRTTIFVKSYSFLVFINRCLCK